MTIKEREIDVSAAASKYTQIHVSRRMTMTNDDNIDDEIYKE
jgi:hypothetical protein